MYCPSCSPARIGIEGIWCVMATCAPLVNGPMDIYRSQHPQFPELAAQAPRTWPVAGNTLTIFARKLKIEKENLASGIGRGGRQSGASGAVRRTVCGDWQDVSEHFLSLQQQLERAVEERDRAAEWQARPTKGGWPSLHAMHTNSFWRTSEPSICSYGCQFRKT